jgi:hypothetical protein
VILGWTYSSDFPTSSDGWDTTFNDIPMGFPPGDIYLSRLSADLSALTYSTFIGGHYHEQGANMVFQSEDSIWIAGTTESHTFPTTPDAYQPEDPMWDNGFLLRFDLTASDLVNTPRMVPNNFSMNIYPNPFNPTTTISFSLSRREHARLRVYDLLGRQVRNMDLGIKPAGDYALPFDAKELASGTYIMRLQTETQMKSRKMVVLK